MESARPKNMVANQIKESIQFGFVNKNQANMTLDDLEEDGSAI